MNFVLAMLSMEREEDETITTVSNVPVGASFRFDGKSYTKTKPVVGHKYNPVTHQEETIVYNAQRLLDNGETFSYFYVPEDTPCLAKEV